MKHVLLNRIAQRTARIGVVGLGYVGLPLVVSWASAGFRVTGIDVDPVRVHQCREGISWIPDIAHHVLEEGVRARRIMATLDVAVFAEQDVLVICVPTPLSMAREPDISAILDTVTAIQTHLRAGQLIILESTTYPGTTEEIILPQLQQTGLVPGEDFFLAFSPERIDPGNRQFGLRNTPKIVGGLTSTCLAVTTALYQTIVETVVPVSSLRVAELAKLLENTFRAVNIGLANEMAVVANVLGVDIWEVIDAARTKPFGFMPFYPGPGVGGHCIPVDPQYLAWKLQVLHYCSRFIDVASSINNGMPRYVVERVMGALNEEGKCLKQAHICVVGVTYKRDASDLRESPALEILELLARQGAVLSYADPYIPTLTLSQISLTSVVLDEAFLQGVDCVIIVTNHSAFDYPAIVNAAPLIVDTRNATAGLTNGRIRRL